MVKRLTTFRIEGSLLERLKLLAKLKRKKRSEIIREKIREVLRDENIP